MIEMSKTLQKVITLILALVMLFGVSAVTIGAVSNEAEQLRAESSGSTTEKGENSGSDESTLPDDPSGAVITGWCDVSYDAATNEITVLLNPDKGAILNMSASQLKEIAALLVEAIKEVAFDDILDEFGGLDLLEGGLDADNLWQKALDVYLSNEYPNEADKKMAFIKEVLDPTEIEGTTVGNRRITDFAQYVSDLVRAAILVKPEILESDVLPGASNINSFIEQTLERLLYDEINSYIARVVDDYIYYAGLSDKSDYTEENAGRELCSLDLIDKVGEYMHVIVKEEVGKYIDNLTDPDKHAEAMADDLVYKYLSDYVDNEIDALKNDVTAYVDAYITAKITRGAALPTPSQALLDYVPDAASRIEGKIQSEISSLIRTYVSKRLGRPASEINSYDYFEQFITSFVDSAVSDIVDNYIYAKTGIGSPKSISGINSSLRVDIENQIDDIFEAELSENLEQYKAYMRKESGAVKPEFYETIKQYVIDVIVSDTDCTPEEALDAYIRWEQGELDFGEYLDDITIDDIVPTADDIRSVLFLDGKLDSLIDQVLERINVESIVAGVDRDELLYTVGSSELVHHVIIRIHRYIFHRRILSGRCIIEDNLYISSV